MPVKTLYKQYLQSVNLSDSTIASKETAFVYFPDLELKEVAYNHAEEYQRRLWQGGRAAKTVNLYTKHLKYFFDWCIKQKYIADNPFAELKLLPEVDRKMPYFEDDELVRILNVSGLRWKILICFGLLGLRLGEALNLLWTELNFGKQELLITPKKDTATTWRWGIKNHIQSYAALPERIELPDIVVQFHLLLYRHRKNQNIPYVNVKPDYYHELIANKDIKFRKRLTPWGNFDRDFKALLKKACVAPKSFHDLRRTFAKRLKDSNFDLKERQTSLRHKSIATTARYYEGIDERELVSRVNAAFLTL